MIAIKGQVMPLMESQGRLWNGVFKRGADGGPD